LAFATIILVAFAINSSRSMVQLYPCLARLSKADRVGANRQERLRSERRVGAAKKTGGRAHAVAATSDKRLSGQRPEDFAARGSRVRRCTRPLERDSANGMPEKRGASDSAARRALKARTSEFPFSPKLGPIRGIAF
jgi:hypothetical protein